MSTSNIPDLEEFEAEVFFDDEKEAAAGKRALEAAGFDIEPRPGLAEDSYQTVWMMARAACARDADIRGLVQTVQELIEPHGGMIWELGPCSEGGPAPPRYYELIKQDFIRTNICTGQLSTAARNRRDRGH